MPRSSRLDAMLAALTAAGGVAPYRILADASSEHTVRAAACAGVVSRPARGMYALPELSPAVALDTPTRAWSRWHEGPGEDECRALLARHARARALDGALSHRCAAAHHGWAVLMNPDRLEVAVPLRRKPARCDVPVRIVQRDLTPDERRTHVTTPVRTVLDCARDLPPAEALAVADSALRVGAVGASELAEAGAAYRGRSAERVRWATSHASGQADNPFESALRAAVLDVEGLAVRPQVEVSDAGFRARVDLADEALRIIFEADSYEFHGSVADFARDRRRYAELTVRGWMVLPFAFRDVVARPGWVASVARAAVLTRWAA